MLQIIKKKRKINVGGGEGEVGGKSYENEVIVDIRPVIKKTLTFSVYSKFS